MWPRLFDRGRSHVSATHQPTPLASMWPRLFDRGRQEFVRTCDRGLQLQCGRGCLTAEGIYKLFPLATESELQCGRGCLTAEGRV